MTTALALFDLISIRFVDVVDIVLVALLFYYIYRAARNTNVMPIFWALIILVVSWRIADALEMRLLGAILSAITSVGLVALVVIFQPEIRRFLLFVGTKTRIDDTWLQRLRFWRHTIQNRPQGVNYEAYVGACMHMSQTKTGALIIFRRSNEVEELIATGERIDATVSSALLETLFFKNSPLHDGAVIVQANKVLAARCILPVTSRTDVDPNLGLRHRSAIGVTEQLDVLAVIVSEETGAISYALDGEIHHAISPVELRQTLEHYITQN